MMKQKLIGTVRFLSKQGLGYSNISRLHRTCAPSFACSMNTNQTQQPQHQHFSSNHHRRSKSTLTVKATSTQLRIALQRLSLSIGFSAKELRDAYFSAAKQCHPDSHSSSKKLQAKATANDHEEDHEDKHDTEAQLTDMFLEITDAYELLRQYPGGKTQLSQLQQDEYDKMDIIPKSEAQYYREAVKEALGIDAEILEESKKCPMFREWLKGRSHMAFHFNLFLMRHGGLAPMLGDKKVEALMEGRDSNSITKRRRRRK